MSEMKTIAISPDDDPAQGSHSRTRFVRSGSRIGRFIFADYQPLLVLDKGEFCVEDCEFYGGDDGADVLLLGVAEMRDTSAKKA